MGTIARKATPVGMSSADALWALIMSQSRTTRRTLTERLLSEDIETGERLLMKASIERGWLQVKTMQQSGTNNGNLQDLINELDKD